MYGERGGVYKFLPSSHRVCRAAYDVELCLYCRICSDHNCSVVALISREVPSGEYTLDDVKSESLPRSILYYPLISVLVTRPLLILML